MVSAIASAASLPRLAAAVGPLGVVIYFVATALHPGHEPGNLQAVLPQYAADHYWLAIHLAQFAGILLSGVLLVALASRGFTVAVSTPAMALSYLTGLWILAQAVLLWRWTGRQPARDTP